MICLIFIPLHSVRQNVSDVQNWFLPAKKKKKTKIITFGHVTGRKTMSTAIGLAADFFALYNVGTTNEPT